MYPLSKFQKLPSSCVAMIAAFFLGLTMKRANQLINISSSEQLHRHTAFHEAGHITAIYIRNTEQELPAVFFEIIFSENQEESDYFKARVEGGRLIEDLCIAEIESKRLKTHAEKSSLQKAY